MDRKSQAGTDASCMSSEQIAFVYRKGRYHPVKQTKLKNSLLAIVGVLEFANAMDFAANVWNSIPVPLFAAILMGIGGSVALIIAFFAFQDAALSRRNIALLHKERHQLKKLRADARKEIGNVPDIDTHLDLTFREIGTEIIDRIGMDSVMGFAAILVGTGTLMAIGGANPKVYKVSNLFSGYLGNGLSAFYGVVNTGWSIFTWRRAHHHAVASEKQLTAPDIKRLQRQRNSTIKLHSALNGVTGLVASVAGIITTTRWWGYVILIPCIVSAIYCNSVWRRKLGYERPSILHSLGKDIPETIEEIRLAALAQSLIREAPSVAYEGLMPNKESISTVIGFLVVNGFFEDFCLRLLKNSDLASAVLGPLEPKLAIYSSDLLKTRAPHVHALFDIAEASIRETGLSMFRDRQRFLLDKLGCQLCIQDTPRVNFEMTEQKTPATDSSSNSTPADLFIAPASEPQPVEPSSKETTNNSPQVIPGSPRVSLAVPVNEDVYVKKDETEDLPRREAVETPIGGKVSQPDADDTHVENEKSL